MLGMVFYGIRFKNGKGIGLLGFSRAFGVG